ncbi:MAG: condensation domain-containing protein, partial [Acidobacteria bacterium]|nr:condensation domain-containing protein [Acidobacteriota bacterium]
MEKLDSNCIENIIALSPSQEGMLFHYLQAPQCPIHFEQLSLEISGNIHISHFENAWQAVIETNELLRTVFRWEKVESPVQIVLKEYPFQPRYIHFSKNDAPLPLTLEQVKLNDKQESFDLHAVPFRVTLCQIETNKYVMIISNHHILYDGWSTGIILKEFFKFYHELSLGRHKESLEIPRKLSFKDFIKWTQSQDKNKKEQFWRNYLSGFEIAAELPIKRKKDETSGTGDYAIRLGEDIQGKLEIFLKNKRITLASIFYSAWGILLQKYGSSEDVVFGTTVSGRSTEVNGIEDMVGLFINTIPLRIITYPDETIIEAIYQVDHILHEREEFEHTPLIDILGRYAARSNLALFDTIMVIENYPLDDRLIPPGCALAIQSYDMAEMTHYDLSIGIMPFRGIEIKFSFKEGIFQRETIMHLAGHFKSIIKTMIEYPETMLSQLEIISNDEKNRILYEFNNTAVEYPVNKTIHQLFEKQADRAPDYIALHGCMIAWMDGEVGAAPRVCPSRNVSLTYRQLDEQSNRLAGLLIEKGVLPDNIVGIKIERSVEMIIGILGILKAGGAYLPIDPSYPQERIEYMLKDSGTKILLTDDEKEKDNCQCAIVNCQLSMSGRPRRGIQHSAFITQHSNLSYIIYTSGSTGKPKGVMIENRSVINFIKGITDVIPFQSHDRILSLTTISFDIFGLETLLPLTRGSAVIMGSSEAQQDVLLGLRIIECEAITIFQATPSRLQLFIQDKAVGKALMKLKYLIIGGEALPRQLLDSLKQQTAARIFNVYGPTEATIWSTIKEVSGNLALNIGKPLANTYIYILSHFGALQPVGVP